MNSFTLDALPFQGEADTKRGYPLASESDPIKLLYLRGRRISCGWGVCIRRHLSNRRRNGKATIHQFVDWRRSPTARARSDGPAVEFGTQPRRHRKTRPNRNFSGNTSVHHVTSALTENGSDLDVIPDVDYLDTIPFCNCRRSANSTSLSDIVGRELCSYRNVWQHAAPAWQWFY
jgi:hypothetical protein